MWPEGRSCIGFAQVQKKCCLRMRVSLSLLIYPCVSSLFFVTIRIWRLGLVSVPAVVCGGSVGILPAPSVVSAGAMNSFSLILTEPCFLFLCHVSTLSGRLSARPKVDNHNFGASFSQSPDFSGLLAWFWSPWSPSHDAGGDGSWQQCPRCGAHQILSGFSIF